MKPSFMAALLAVSVLAASATTADAKKPYHKRSYGVVQVLPHPAGCPRRLFCGCGVSVKVWGKPIRKLYLATNYGVYFNRTHFRSGAVGYRPGHVLYVMGGTRSKALVYDPNSGRGKTQLRYRDLSRYTFVDPHSPKRSFASL